MVNRSKAKGTAGETAIVEYLKSRGWRYAERRTLSGSKDRGDIAGIAGVVIEAKNANAITPGPWLNEAHVERDNDSSRIGVVWFKRRQTTDPGKWFVLMDGETFTDLLIQGGYQ